MTPTPEEARDIALASRILARRGIVDAFGHVSLRRTDGGPGFVMSRSVAPALVGVDDVLVLDAAGETASGEIRTPFLERFIHAEIYRARPDVQAVVHSHSHAVIPYSIVKDAPLRPVFHMAGFLGEGAPIFEIRDHAGPESDMLVRNASLGRALAEVLGSGAVVLMRGHGSPVVGSSLPEAVFRAVYLEANARIQSDALVLGTVTALTAAEARNSAEANAGQINRAWTLWCGEVDF